MAEQQQRWRTLYAPATGTVWGRAVWRDARDGGVETGEGVHVFDGEV